MWAEIVMYLLNNRSSQTLNVTQYEPWNENTLRQTQQQTQICGSTGYVHVAKEKTKELHKQGEKMTLVGFDNKIIECMTKTQKNSYVKRCEI